MDQQTFQAIRDLVEKNDQIGIAVGKNPSLDEMGASLALYLFLKNEGKKVSIACPTQPLVEISNLVGIDKVKTSIEAPGGDLIVSFPYREEEIQKVSYTLENGFLNIIVKAGEQGLSFSEKDVEYKHGGGVSSLLFIVGTARLSDLDNLFDPEALKETKVINIDNKTQNQGFGDVVFVSPRYSSVSEEVADLLFFLNPNLDVDTAQNLLSGISFATNNFQDQKADYLAFEMTGKLMKIGAVRNPVTQNEPQNKDFFPPLKQNFPSQKQFQNQMGRQNQNRFPQRPVQNPFQRSGQQQSSQGGFRPQQQNQFQPQQSQNQNQQRNEDKKDQKEETPSDWLTPKVYKGSTLV